eukprot:SAG31_NODE_9762_length_1230_cov_10.711760_1_plen_88_part_10
MLRIATNLTQSPAAHDILVNNPTSTANVSFIHQDGSSNCLTEIHVWVPSLLSYLHRATGASKNTESEYIIESKTNTVPRGQVPQLSAP